MAMVLARVMGDNQFRERVKIYATDVDEEALDLARHAAYQPRQILVLHARGHGGDDRLVAEPQASA